MSAGTRRQRRNSTNSNDSAEDGVQASRRQPAQKLVQTLLAL